jgi:hypothetical protein
VTLTPTGKIVKQLAAVLSAEYDSVEDAASAALEEAWAAYEARGNWIVAGQIRFTDGRYVNADDGRASKVAVGPFATRGQAVTAGESLALSKRTGEEFRWWVLELFHGSPATLHKLRQDDRKAAQLLDNDAGPRIAAAKAFGMERWPDQDTLDV